MKSELGKSVWEAFEMLMLMSHVVSVCVFLFPYMLVMFKNVVLTKHIREIITIKKLNIKFL